MGRNKFYDPENEETHLRVGVPQDRYIPVVRSPDPPTVEVRTGLALGVLASLINDAHRRAENADRGALAPAMQAGQLLVEAKAQVKHGQWLPWVAEHCDFPVGRARQYMRLHRDSDALHERLPRTPAGRIKSAAVAALTLREAMKLLSEPEPPKSWRPPSGKRLMYGDDGVAPWGTIAESSDHPGSFHIVSMVGKVTMISDCPYAGEFLSQIINAEWVHRWPKPMRDPRNWRQVDALEPSDAYYRALADLATEQDGSQ